MQLLLALYNPPAGKPMYYHGDIRAGNLVVAGSTLQLTDYGTLVKVDEHPGHARHKFPTHQQPFHSSCESVDVWGAGITLLDMLVIGSCGRVFNISTGRGGLKVNHGVEVPTPTPVRLCTPPDLNASQTYADVISSEYSVAGRQKGRPSAVCR